MKEHGHSSNSLADAVNQAIGEVTGKVGGIDGSQVRDWKAGRVRWPKATSRAGLEKVAGLSAVDLGFVPRRRASPTTVPQKEDSLRRRTFVTSATLAGPGAVAGTRIGVTDIGRFEQHLAELVQADDRSGGHGSTERRALWCADTILDLQQGSSASQRVRQRLYFLAAAFTSTATWAAIDARKNARAQRHLEKALVLAGYSGDPRIQHRVWGHASLLAVQQKRFTGAVAAGEAARKLSISRRDPLFGSLARTRLAGAYSRSGQQAEALRVIHHAERVFERADGGDGSRPAWMNFFDRAEMVGLRALIDLDLGRYEQAESHLHHALSLIRPELQRNRAYYTCKLALAQLGQGEIDLACETAASVPGISRQAAVSGRVGKLLNGFGGKLLAVAPDASATRAWLESRRSQEGRT